MRTILYTMMMYASSSPWPSSSARRPCPTIRCLTSKSWPWRCSWNPKHGVRIRNKSSITRTAPGSWSRDCESRHGTFSWRWRACSFKCQMILLTLNGLGQKWSLMWKTSVANTQSVASPRRSSTIWSSLRSQTAIIFASRRPTRSGQPSGRDGWQR